MAIIINRIQIFIAKYLKADIEYLIICFFKILFLETQWDSELHLALLSLLSQNCSDVNKL